MPDILCATSDRSAEEKSAKNDPVEKEKYDLPKRPNPSIFPTSLIFKNHFGIYTFQTLHNGRIGKHSHEFYEIIYITDGFTLHSLNGTMNILVTGDLLFIKPGEGHSYINAYQTKLYNLLFMSDELGSFCGDLSFLPGLAEMFTDGDIAANDRTGESSGSGITDDTGRTDKQISARIVHVPINERRSIESALEKLREEQETKKTGWKCSMRARLMSFLIKYSRMHEEQWESKSKPIGEYYGYIYKILRYIDENYAGDISMNDLSEVTGLSPDYMSRRFKEALHMPPSEYLRKFRIARAMELLCTTDLSVAEVASRTGFSDVSLFSRVFKQFVGLPPASYKKNASSD